MIEREDAAAHSVVDGNLRPTPLDVGRCFSDADWGVLDHGRYLRLCTV